MEFDWQTWAALFIVALAALTAIRRLVFSGNAACGGGCTGCSFNTKRSDGLPKLVQLHSLSKHE